MNRVSTQEYKTKNERENRTRLEDARRNKPADTKNSDSLAISKSKLGLNERSGNKERPKETQENNAAHQKIMPVAGINQRGRQPNNIRANNGLPRNTQPRSEQERKNSLENTRRNDTSQKTRPSIDMKKSAQQLLSSASLLKYIEPFTDWLFGIALMCAMLKDLLDLTGIGLMGIGQFFAFFCSAIILFSLVLTGGNGSRKNMAKKIIKRYGTPVVGTALECICGIDFVPIETCIVILVFFFTLQDRQEAEMEQQTILAT